MRISLSASLLILSCEGSCFLSGGIAELSEAAGVVERDQSARVGAWSAAKIGDRFSLGDGVRTATLSTARVEFAVGGGVSMEENTTARFLARPDRAPGVAVEFGEGTLESGDRLKFGLALIDPRSEITVTRENGTLRLRVTYGNAVVERPVSAPRPPPPPPSPPRPSPPPPPPEPVRPPPPRSSSLFPERAHLSIPAGESPFVHDPSPPIAIDVLSHCKNAVTELATKNGWVRAPGTIVSVEGAQRYRVKCPGKKRRMKLGRITVMKDSGTKPLSKAAPENAVTADGRNYTVLYQNRMPRLMFDWKDAPKADVYVFTIASDLSEKKVTTNRPEIRMDSKEIGEGSFRFWFGAKDVRSLETRLVIDFDNAAPKLVIEGGNSTLARSEGKVRVQGAAAEGTRVTIAGVAIALDRHRRFDAEVELPPERDGIAIRIQDRRGQVHYYVRRIDPR